MNSVRGHMAILAGAGVSAVLVSVFLLVGRQSGTASSAQVSAVVTLHQRPIAAPAATPPKPEPAAVAPVARDPASLARALQRELKRVGCYEGEVSGVWSPPSRAAMKAFTEHVNATLPVDAPDQILLALVQGHRGQACGAACRPNEAQAGDGRCLPKAIVAKADRTGDQADAKTEPAITPVPVPVPAVRVPAPPRAEPATPAPAARAAPPPHAQEPPQAQPQAQPEERSPRQAGPVPAVGVYERRPRRPLRRGSSPRPPAMVRSLIRSLKRASSVW
jgi:hypothetical protein